MRQVWGFRQIPGGFRSRVLAWAGACALALPLLVCAAQVDISGPAGSVAFGTSVTVLSNSNFVVTDPNGPVSGIGAVYLYGPSGTLISTLTGSSTNDHIGSSGVVVVGLHNFVVRSPNWNNGGASTAGAVTWVNGSTGLSGVVSASNSLIGTTSGDFVGNGGVTVLSNGNYVVASFFWNNGVVSSKYGAATWGNGTSGISGPVSASNSLIGTTTDDQVGNNGVIALSNGNYVVASANWNNGVANSKYGAATWGNGSTGLTGAVSASNSLIGTTTGDYVGLSGVTALSNGNYVVASANWNNGVANSKYGAATWSNGSTGLTGAVSASNSLIGTTTGDQVGSNGVTALSNGNYVVRSSYWHNGPTVYAGAATWSNGSTGLTGAVSASNSLIGTTTGDQVCSNGVTALSNGNYVVASAYWNNGVASSEYGAATWGNGSSGTTGTVSASNSLIGATTGDQVSNGGVTALSNGNYVVASSNWNNGVANSKYGAATWGNGSSGITGAVSASNSLIGTTIDDYVGGGGVTTLSDGNYVVASFLWNNGVANSKYGAATWGNGSSGITGPVLASNSLIGTTTGDYVGYPGVTALSNGNYVVASADWNIGVANSRYGAATWGNGSTGLTGAVSASNSLIGTTTGDYVGLSGVTALSNGNYVVGSPFWSGNLGAVTLASGAFRLKATIQPWNSVRGTAAGGGPQQTYAYDPARQRLIVGQPASNIVSLFSMDQIFASDFEP